MTWCHLSDDVGAVQSRHCSVYKFPRRFGSTRPIQRGVVYERHDAAGGTDRRGRTGKPRLRPTKRPITVRHLLTHTSGYTYANWSEALTRYEMVTGLPDIATLRNAAFDAPLEFDPGDRWEYGISMDWVGKLVEEVTDQSLEIYFRENIFEPLGMKDSGFLIGSEQKRRAATLFNRQPDGTLAPAPFEMPQRPQFFMGGGGAFSTP